MLDHLRQKAAQTLASASTVILSSYGPADIQSSRVSCTSQDLTLYIFIRHNSDHQINLAQRRGVVVTTGEWDLQGDGRVLAPADVPAGIKPPGGGESPNDSGFGSNTSWGWVVVEVRPTRLTLHSGTGLGNTETIDF